MIVATLCSSECQPVLDWVATVGARSFLALSHVSNTLEEVVGPNFGAELVADYAAFEIAAE